MAKTLESYSKKKKVLLEDKEIMRFLDSVPTGRLLIINAGSGSYAAKKGFDVTVVEEDLALIKEARKKNPKVKYEYSNLFQFAKRTRKDSFDAIIDNSYSQALRRSELHRLYKQLGKMLRFDGKLFSKVLSVDDEYCKKHCPKRHWTMVEGQYMNFFEKKLILKFHRKYGFSVDKYLVATDERTSHVVYSTLRSMKL